MKYPWAMGTRIPGLVLDAVGANSVRRKVRGSNLAQPVIPFWSATTLEHVLEFRTSRRTRQQATNATNHPGKDVPGFDRGR